MMADFIIDENSTCNKCGKNGIMKKEGLHYVLKYDCKCGGRFVTDWLKAMSKKGDE